MEKIEFKIVGVSKNNAFTLQELTIAVAVLIVISTVATFKIIDIRKKTVAIQEQSVIRLLYKAAVLYNTYYDKWYGMVDSENIFTGLLENPPPFYLTDVFGMMNIPGNGRDWKLVQPSDAGVGKWVIGCPHQTGLGSKGTWWTFNVEGGKMTTPYGNQHNWP